METRTWLGTLIFAVLLLGAVGGYLLATRQSRLTETDKTRGSRDGKFLVALAGVIVCIALGLVIGVPFDDTAPPVERIVTHLSGWVPALYALSFFVWVVIFALYRSSTDAAFLVNTRRLALDTMMSVLLSITGFAVLYKLYGIEWTGDAGAPIRPIDYLYFSVVTFSTLGYGDFRPSPGVRMIAATQALIGNLHLGIIVGLGFFASRPLQEGADDETRPGSG